MFGEIFHYYSYSKPNSVHPEQTLRCVASDLGQHCLHMPNETDSMLI